MFKTLKNTIPAARKNLALAAAIATNAVLLGAAHAQTATIQSAVTDAIDDAKSAADAILIVAAGLIASFIVFKVAKRAANKA